MTLQKLVFCVKILKQKYSINFSPGPHKFTDSVLGRLRLFDKKVIGLDGGRESDANLVVYQVNAEIPFELDIAFESGSNRARKGKRELCVCRHEKKLSFQRIRGNFFAQCSA